MSAAAIPVTVLTGFLGAGKTTLVNRLLREAHGRRLAVIENEYGAVNVDADLLVNDGGETIVQLTNGCVCCTVRGDLADALERLAARRAAGEIAFDHVLIEPTGLADPGPIVRTFMAGTALQARYFLDGVVTLFDGLHGLRSLGESVEAQAQLAYADRVLVTKVDQLPDAAAIEAVIVRLRAAQAVAEIVPIDLLNAPWGEMFDALLALRGYQFDRVVWAPKLGADNRVEHTRGVGSVLFTADSPLDGARLNAALAAIDARYGERMWRIKGVLAVHGVRSRLIVQGVQGLFQTHPSTPWRLFEPQRSRLVLIGCDLDRDWLLQQLGDCLQTAVAAPLH